MGRERVGLTLPARDALVVLGQQVRFARQQGRITAADLAARAGVSARTVAAVERGEPTVSIGNVLNIAVAAGVPLFGAENEADLLQLRRIGEDRLALIPTRVRRARTNDADVDF